MVYAAAPAILFDEFEELFVAGLVFGCAQVGEAGLQDMLAVDLLDSEVYGFDVFHGGWEHTPEVLADDGKLF